LADNACRLSTGCWQDVTLDDGTTAILDACPGDSTFNESSSHGVFSVTLPLGNDDACNAVQVVGAPTQQGSMHTKESCAGSTCVNGFERREHHVSGTFEGKFPSIHVGDTLASTTTDCVITNGTFDLTTCSDFTGGDAPNQTSCGSH
jgi:hypothetical protein